MKHITILLFAFVIIFSAQAQRVRFKDLALALDTVSVDQQFSFLREFMLEDENHANANYRLAILHYRIFRNADPLLEYRKAMAHAREASLRLLRAKMIVTAQDVRNNNEYYAGYFKTTDAKGKPYVDFPVVVDQMNVASDSAKNFQEKMPAIYRAFTKSVQHYDKAVNLFAGLNTEYKSLEDIYMFYGPAMEGRLETLKQSYDSSIVYFQRYQQLIAEYPISKYNQKFHVKPIQVYRMDGLITHMDFLARDVEFWNYSAWVDAIRKKHSDEIAAIRLKIERHENEFNQAINLMQNAEASAEPKRLAKDLIFELNNYDKNSLALALLEYKGGKQDWLSRFKNIARDTAVDARLDLYSQLIQQNRITDTLLTHLEHSVNAFSIKKHADFIDKYYGGAKGLQSFVEKEKQWIATTFQEYQEVLKSSLTAYSQVAGVPNKFVKAGNLNVPLFIETKTVAELQPSTIMTTRIEKNPDGSVYLAGVHRMNKKANLSPVAYLVRVGADGKAAWLKELSFSPDSIPSGDVVNYIGDIVTTQEGCAVLVTSVRADKQASVNTFVFINEKGEIKSIKVKNTDMGRKLIYQESSNSFVMAFKGMDEVNDFSIAEKISMTSINILGDLLWHQEIPVSGDLVDVIPVRDGFVVIGNYAVIRNHAGQEIRTRVGEGQSNPFLAKVGLRGEMMNIQPLTSSQSVHIKKVVKVNDGSINLIGNETTFHNSGTGSAGKVLHMMTNYALKSVCANF
jgi:hypothetical protein